jgi:hypothetical protein
MRTQKYCQSLVRMGFYKQTQEKLSKNYLVTGTQHNHIRMQISSENVARVIRNYNNVV